MPFNRVENPSDGVRVQRVLISTFDKTGLTEFVSELFSHCPTLELYSTGGTYQTVYNSLSTTRRASLKPITELTGRREMQGGLVKTLDYRVYLGLLAEPGNQDHDQHLSESGAKKLDMVVVNLYPFVDAIGGPNADLEHARGHIDIGGPTMLRAAAKNFLRVAPVTDPSDYPRISAELETNRGRLGLHTRFELARKVFELTAQYDRAIADYLNNAGTTALHDDYSVSDDREQQK
jgi:phosphoribosylaminoimidazolecarboxamide formyltransferase/IMP cyclohydrolase